MQSLMKWIGMAVAWWGELTGLPRVKYRWPNGREFVVDWAMVTLVMAMWVAMGVLAWIF